MVDIDKILSNKNLSDGDKELVSKILGELANRGDSELYKQLLNPQYEEVPVTIDRFIEDPDYLGDLLYTIDDNGIKGAPGSAIFPYWRNALREILHGGNSYLEIIFAGSIGLGKSYIGCILGAYLLYRLLCLKNPQAYYGLAPTETITFAFFNIHKYLSNEVAYGKFQRLLQGSPWFLRHGQIRGTKNPEYYPDKNITFMVGCDEEHAIGQNIFFALLDEMSFAKKPNADMLKSGIMKLYRSVDARMTSRFMKGGVLHAKKILISSKKTDSDFLDQYTEQKKLSGDPNVYIVDEPHWVVKPQAYGTKKFRLAVGSKVKPSIIIEDNDKRPDDWFLANGYTKVIYPPIETRDKFAFDMDATLRDLAGISTSVFTKFIDYQKLSACYTSKLENPFTNPEPIVGLTDDVTLQDYYDLSKVPDWVRELPMYIHLDIALSGDGYGIGCAAVAGTKMHYSIQLGEQVTDPVYIHVFSARIKCNKGDQVSLEKVRQFIYWLKFTEGYNIKRVSTDGFMSADTRQAMITRGIDADLVSLDRKPDGYLTFRTAIYEKRIVMLNVPILEDELVNLERNEMTGKIDHTATSQKDASDGICGAVYNASLHNENYSPVAKSVELILEVNEANDISKATTEDLEKQLMGLVNKSEPKDSTKNLITDSDDIDTILNKVTGNKSDASNNIPDYMKDYYASMGILM